MRRRRASIKLEDFLRRRPRRNRLAWALGLVLFIALVVLDRSGGLRVVLPTQDATAGHVQGPDLERYDGRAFRVLRVVDGDTLDIDAPDGRHGKTRVRIWGIDAPEIAHPPHTTITQPYGREAADYLERRVAGQSVKLLLEPSRLRDRYDRLLAHVELASGPLVAEELIGEGLATADDRWNHRYRDHFARAESEAKRRRIGIWGQKMQSKAE